MLSLCTLDVHAAFAEDFRIVTWNSTGEQPPRDTTLRDEVNALNNAYPATPTRSILNQEALQAISGAIYNMLNNPAVPPNGLGPNYQRPPQHTTENLNGTGRGYNALLANNLTINQGLTLHNYQNDATFTNWVNSLSQAQQTIVWNEVNRWRPPVSMGLQTASGQTVRLMTWHAPLDVSQLLSACPQPAGGAPLDAFLFLEQSSLLNNVAGINIVIIAGELNMTQGDLQNTCGGLYEPLSNFEGVSSNLDRILAWRPVGANPTFFENRRTPTPGLSPHDIFSARVHW